MLSPRIAIGAIASSLILSGCASHQPINDFRPILPLEEQEAARIHSRSQPDHLEVGFRVPESRAGGFMKGFFEVFKDPEVWETGIWPLIVAPFVGAYGWTCGAAAAQVDRPSERFSELAEQVGVAPFVTVFESGIEGAVMVGDQERPVGLPSGTLVLDIHRLGIFLDGGMPDSWGCKPELAAGVEWSIRRDGTADCELRVTKVSNKDLPATFEEWYSDPVRQRADMADLLGKLGVELRKAFTLGSPARRCNP